MRKIVIAILLFTSSASFAGEIYKQRTADGRVVYSDVRYEGAELLEQRSSTDTLPTIDADSNADPQTLSESMEAARNHVLIVRRRVQREKVKCLERAEDSYHKQWRDNCMPGTDCEFLPVSVVTILDRRLRDERNGCDK